MPEVSVLIPVYKADLSPNEARSLSQCLNVLGAHPIRLVAPEGLDTAAYDRLAGRTLAVDRFAPEYFRSVSGYSKLLLSKSFYQRFDAYRYILIYQLDAWVFTDTLLEWCRRSYDYIGAPWLEAPSAPPGTPALLNLSKRLKNKVGNGGLSLRRVKAHKRWAPWVSFIFRYIPKNEDLLWTLFAPFRKPPAREALRFAFELNPAASYRINQQQLPFGCHAWEKYDPDFWKQFI